MKNNPETAATQAATPTSASVPADAALAGVSAAPGAPGSCPERLAGLPAGINRRGGPRRNLSGREAGTPDPEAGTPDPEAGTPGREADSPICPAADAAKLALATFGASVTRPEAIETIPLANLMIRIQQGEWRKPVTALRKQANPILRKEMKQRLPYFVCALFDGRRESGKLIQANGIVLDLDHLTDDEIAGYKETIPLGLPCARWLFRSPVDGLKVVVPFARPITGAEEYQRVFNWLRREMHRQFGVVPDNTPDLARACFVSWDEEFVAVSGAVALDPDETKESGTDEQMNRSKEAAEGSDWGSPGSTAVVPGLTPNVIPGLTRDPVFSDQSASPKLKTGSRLATPLRGDPGVRDDMGNASGDPGVRDDNVLSAENVVNLSPSCDSCNSWTPTDPTEGQAISAVEYLAQCVIPQIAKPTDPTEVQAISAVEYLAQRVIPHRDWIRCGIALYNHFGEDGLVYWLQFAYNPHYPDTPDELRKIWTRLKKYPSVGIGTLFWIAEREGWINAIGGGWGAADIEIEGTRAIGQEGQRLGTQQSAAVENPGVQVRSLPDSRETPVMPGLTPNVVPGLTPNVVPGLTRDPFLSERSASLKQKTGSRLATPLRGDPGVRDDTHCNEDIDPDVQARSLPDSRETPHRLDSRQGAAGLSSVNLLNCSTLKDFPELLELFGRPSNVPLDRNRLPEAINRYLDTVGRVTDAQDGAKLTAFLPVVAANIGNRIYMYNAGTRHYCNVWAAIIGPSTVSRKTTVINQAMKMLQPFKDSLRELTPKERNEQDLELCRVTQARLYNLLGINPNRLLLHMELSAWMQEMNKAYNAGMKQEITDMFDGKDRNIAKMEIDEYISRPAFSIIGATTEDWFYRELREVADQRGGFLQRFIICIIQNIDVDTLRLEATDDPGCDRELHAWDEPLAVFRSLPDSHRLHASEEALELRNGIYKELMTRIALNANDPQAAYCARIFDNYFWRFCILIFLLRNWQDLRDARDALRLQTWFQANRVDETTARQAWYLCEYYFANTQPFLKSLSENAKLDNEKKIVRILQKAPEQRLSHSRLLCKSSLLAREFRACMESLIERQAVICHEEVGYRNKVGLIYSLNPVLQGVDIS